MEKLRIDSGVRRIEVNDAGECIEISINDTRFFNRFAEMLRWLEEKQAEVDQAAEEYAQKYGEAFPVKEDGTKEVNTEAVMEIAGLHMNLCEEVCARLDGLFGESCCRKVFGDMVPDENLIGEFLEAITPILNKFAGERREKLQLRYSRSRKGANGK